MSKKKRKKLYKRPAWMDIPNGYPLMDKVEYERARRAFAMPSNQFAFMVGVGWRQGQRYQHGEAAIPPTVAKLIRTIIRHGLGEEDIG